MKHVRRVISHHGSDCPDGPHPFRRNRCMILTRVDFPGQRSEYWLTGDCQEGRVFQRNRSPVNPSKPVWYGGGFWERVQIDPLPEPESVQVPELKGVK